MMDFHILVVISCVFLASLFSWLFISKFFRRKTFDEVLAEKKALSDKIYAQNKAAAKKPKKLQQNKKELKREKKQRQREERREQTTTTTEHDDSDTEAEKNVRDEDDEQPVGLSKTHVEFEPDPIVLSNEVVSQAQQKRRESNAEKEASNAKLKSNKKDNKKSNKTAVAATGILLNKNEPIAIKANLSVDETLNNFEAKPPKDVVELKKADKEKERKDEKVQQQHQAQPQQHAGKKEKHTNKKEKPAPTPNATAANAVEPRVAETPVQQIVVKEVKQIERHASPKAQQQQQQQAQNGHNNNNTNAGHKNKQQKKQSNKESAIQREIAQALEKLSDTDSVSVSLLMNLFRRAELNRSEIQILIDYLLNKQQDTPASHSEWSDDICQKLKRQLEEKERALAEEQEASLGLQAKLRKLRSEINAERLQMNATIKSYTDEMQFKDQELAGLSQELQSVNEKLSLERQQFQAKLLHEKQASSQDLLAQLQHMQNEIAEKDKFIAELTCLVNASRQESQQRNEIIQTQAQQVRTLEQQREELEQVSNNHIFELEKAKQLETENSEIKVELRNLQNELESSKADITQAHKELEAIKSQLDMATIVKNNEIEKYESLQKAFNDLQQELKLEKTKNAQQSKQGQTAATVQANIDELQQRLAGKEQELAAVVRNNATLQEHNANSSKIFLQKQQELQQRIDTLSAEVASKQKQLQELERVHLEKFTNREKELLQQLQEQKEKNNDLRMKNWKLVEALQNAETNTLKENKMLSNNKTNLVQQQQQQQQFQVANTNSSSKDDKQLRELLQRLYPEAVKACAGSALSLPFDQWIEQVLATHVKQLAAAATNTSSSSHKSTQSNGSSYNSSHNSSHNNNNSLINENSSRTTNKLSTETSSGSSGVDGAAASGGDDPISDNPVELQKENIQLRVKNEELTRLLMKTSNVLSDIESHAREQDENWRSIVRSKDEQISALQFSNGEQGI